MLQPIQIGHELICPCGCGVVVGTIEESNTETHTQVTKYSADVFLLGSALQKNVRSGYNRTPQQAREEAVFKRLTSIAKNYGLPQSIAIETFSELKRKNRGFWSETEPIKQLIKILSKDDNYQFIHKLREIKAWYEKVSNM